LSLIPELTIRAFQFRRLDLSKLYKNIPALKKKGLERLTLRDQIYRLRRYGLKRNEINRYIKRLPFPKVGFYTPYPWDDLTEENAPLFPKGYHFYWYREKTRQFIRAKKPLRFDCGLWVNIDDPRSGREN
jgi:hypothetical protein